MGYLPRPVQSYFANQHLEGFSLDYAVEKRPLGTAGGIKNAEEYLNEGPFVATNGDVLTGIDLTEIIEAHMESGALATITLTAVDDPPTHGLVEVHHRLRVKRFVEKPGSEEVHTSLINAGIYVLERQILNVIPTEREGSIEREIFPQLQAMERLSAFVSSAYWLDIRTPCSYLAASNDMLSGAGRCEIEAGATISGRTSIGEGCFVGEDTMVEGIILFGGVWVGRER
jgi:mannose-1-phosphate guanylyltransferase